MKRLLLVLFIMFAVATGLGDETLIIDETIDQPLESPCAAHDWRSHTFMTVWAEKNADNTAGSILFQRLSEEGDFLGDPTYVIQASTGMRDQPAIAYCPYLGTQKFLIVYVLNDDSIWGRFCSSAGDMDSLFKIVDVSSSETVASPALVYDPIDHMFLLAYAHNGEHISGTVSSQIFVQRLTYAGTVIGSPILISDPSGLTDATKPSIASLGLQSLVVWQEQKTPTSSQYNVYGCMVEGGATASGVLPIAISNYTHEHPAVAANDRTQEYLVVFSGRGTSVGALRNIYGLCVQSNSVRNSARMIASDVGYNLWLPALAYERDNNRFVVAWSGLESGTMTFGSKVQTCRVNELGSRVSSIETLCTETSPFSSCGSVNATVSDTDISLVSYRENWLQSSSPIAQSYQILAWRDEYCIDADINCDHHVNLADYQILAESWLVNN